MVEVDDREVTFCGRGCKPGKPVLWSAGLCQANVDVSCLLSKPVAGLRMGIPRINTFSGDTTPGKIKVSFEQW